MFYSPIEQDQSTWEFFKRHLMIPLSAILITILVFGGAYGISKHFIKKKPIEQVPQKSNEPNYNRPQSTQQSKRQTVTVVQPIVAENQSKGIQSVSKKEKLDTAWQLPYETRVHNVMYNNWSPPSHLPNCYVIITFTADKHGTLSDLKFIQKSGVPSFDESVIKAFKKTNRVERHLETEAINLNFKFPRE